MVNSAGKMLREARLQKKLEIGDASRATKIRPDRLLDLENDDYTRFANMAYAKGFLVIYSKYLGVDVSEFSRAMGVGNPVGTADYDYLSNTESTRAPAATRREHLPLKLNYKLIGAVCATVVVMFWVMQFAEKIKRIGSADKLIQRKSNPEIIAAPQASPAWSPARPPEPPPMAPSIAANPVAPPEPVIEIRRAEPVIENTPQQTVPSTPGTSSTDAKTQRPRKSRTH